MTDDLNVILASNRGPVSFVKAGDGYEIRRGAGGAAPALNRAARRLENHAHWIAAMTSRADREAIAAGAGEGLEEMLGYSVELLDIDPDIYSAYYNVASNRMLWFAHHCLFEEIGMESFGRREVEAWVKAYEPVNRMFAETVARYADRQSLVFFQDYHLSTAPLDLRQILAHQPSAHFTHSAFCGPNGLRHLPADIARRVIEGMLGADLVGFHVHNWVRGFLASCVEMGFEVDWDRITVKQKGRETWVRTYPIPIDAEYLRRRAEGRKAQRWIRDLTEGLEGPLIVRADRMEPSKNIVRGFEAFGVLLDRRPDLARSARFVACLYPSRESMREYQRYGKEVQAAVGAVTDRHPGSIRLFLRDSFDRTVAALSLYDVLLINPLMDGMNLVAKEGPALNGRDGVVVLSEGAGAFSELGSEAVGIKDPGNVDDTADALERAIEMPLDDRKRMAGILRERVESNRPDDWIEDQLEDLVEIHHGRDPHTAPI
jgi:trehalose 6-phosphate synthase